MDNLSMNSLAATRAGMSYGRWKVFHPITKKDEELAMANHKKKYTKNCIECGQKFSTNKENKIYCCEECRIRYKNRDGVRKFRERMAHNG